MKIWNENIQLEKVLNIINSYEDDSIELISDDDLKLKWKGEVYTDTFLSLILLRTFIEKRKQPIYLLYSKECKMYTNILNSFTNFAPKQTFDADMLIKTGKDLC